MAPAGLCYPLYVKRELKKRRQLKLKLEFKEAILILASFLRAGYSMENAFSLTRTEVAGLLGKESLMAKELEGICRGLANRRPAEEVLLDLGERSGLEDVYNFAQVFAAAKRRGGDMVEIIRHTAGVIRDKIQVQEEIRTMTAARIFEQRIMNLIPFLLVFYIDFSSPGFFDSVYGSLGGRCVMTVCLLVYVGAVLLAKKILEIPV